MNALRLAVLAAVLCAASSAVQSAGPTSEAVEAYAVDSRAARADAITRVDAQLADSEQRLASARKSREGTREERAERVANAETALANLKNRRGNLLNPSEPFYLLNQEPIGLAAGKVTGLDCDAVIVDVTSGAEALVTLQWYKTVEVSRTTASGLKYTASDPRVYSKVVWLTGYPTAGMTTDQMIDISGVFFCDGTKSYETVDGGQNTVLAIRPFKLAADDQRFLGWHLAREWTDKTGRHSTRAVLGAYARGEVELHAADGRVVNMKLDQLSDDDAQFVREWQRARRKPSD